MRPTRRGWATIGLAGGCLILAVLLESPAVLLAATGLAAFLLAAQVRFVRALGRLADETTVSQQLTPGRTRVDEPSTYRADLTLPAVPRGPITVTPNPPVGFKTTHTDTTTVSAAARDLTVAVAGTLPAAGTFTFDPPTMTATDQHDLFNHTLAVGDETRLSVEPRGPRDVHIGTGGTQIGIAYGEHSASQGSAGIEPSEIRRYLPGDPTNRIDWKATARLNEPHIREFEAETDQRTLLVVDRRTPMLAGPAAETKLDYARDLALWFTDGADRFSDPLGLWTVTDEGVDAQQAPASTDEAYRRIRTHLTRLVPDAAGRGNGTPAQRRSGAREAHAAALATADRDTDFDRTLGAYFSESNPYVTRVEEQPLYRTVHTALSRTSGQPLVVLVTDDTHRVEVRETVKSARRRGEAVVVFLLPSVLFDAREDTNLEAAYDQYVSFESFRHDLASLDAVTAFEVGPAVTLQALLEAGRTSREVSQ